MAVSTEARAMQEQMLAYAQSALAESDQYLAQLAREDNYVRPSVVVPYPATVLLSDALLNSGLDRLRADLPAGIDLTQYNFDAVASPSAPVIGAFSTPAQFNIPDLELVAPVLSDITAPTTGMPAEPGAAPEFVSPVLPDKPVLVLPDVPVFTPVVIPDSVNIEMPVLDATLPYDELTLTTSEFTWAEQAYESALLDTVKAKLLNDLINGGYGIEPEDEERIWERMRERELKEADAAIQEVARLAGAKGFSLPPGAAIARMDEARRISLEKISSASREVAIKRADMYVENRKFALTQSTQLEQVLMGFHSAVAERAFNAAKTQVELGVALFNARLARFGAQLDSFKAAASVYETRIRGAQLALEAYKTRVESARISADIQKLYTEIYISQLEGLKTLTEIYSTEISAAQTLAGIERLKLEAFKLTVDTYTARVGARVAQYQMFESQLRGESLKIQNYSAQASAYGIRLESYKTRAQIDQVRSTVEIAQAESKLSRYRTDIDRYRTDLGRVNNKLTGALQYYGSNIQRYSASAGATGKFYDLATEVQKTNAAMFSEQSRSVIAKAQVELEVFIRLMEARTGGLQKVAGSYTQNAVGALNAINTIAANINNSTPV